MKSVQTNEENCMHFIIDIDFHPGIRKAILKILLGNNIEVLEISKKEVSFEKIFTQLTNN